MEKVGLVLGVVGTGLALIGLGPEFLPKAYHNLCFHAGVAITLVGVLMGIWPVLRAAKESGIIPIGHVPLLAAIKIARDSGIAGEKDINDLTNWISRCALLDKIRLYGEHQQNGGEMLPISKEHLQQHIITAQFALQGGSGNYMVCTYDPTLMFSQQDLTTCFFNIHSSREIIKLLVSFRPSSSDSV